MECSADQQALELRMAQLGVDRYRSAVAKARDKKRETTTPAGRYLLREALDLYVVGLKEWCDNAKATAGRHHGSLKFIEQLPLEMVAFIVTKVTLDCVGHELALSAAAGTVAGAIEDEIRFQSLKKNHKALVGNLNRKTKLSSTKHKRKVLRAAASRELTEERWAKRDALKTGIVLLELFRLHTGLVEIRQVFRGRKKLAILEASEQTLKWLEASHAAHEVLLPFFLPCVDRPAPWTQPIGGGYRTNALMLRPLVKAASRSVLRECETRDMSEVYSAVNALQDTVWEIDPRVADVLTYCWDRGLDVADLPRREDEALPEKPDDIATNEQAKRDWKHAASSTYRRNVSMRSNRLQTSKLLFMAQMFTGLRFHYPYQADFRGRLYCVPYFLQPQGPSQARGLLRFADGKAIDTVGAERWLAIHGANCFGVDKVSMDARVEWVAKNEPLIFEVGRDALASQWWAAASKPWEFLAFCFEWTEYRKHGRGYLSKLPVSMDGSNNGLQVFSLLLRDPVGGAATNCTPSPVPRDIYQDVADRVTERLHATDSPLGAEWLVAVDGRVPRECCKRSVMTLPYGSTLFSCRQYVSEWYRDYARTSGRDVFAKRLFAATNWLAALVWEAIHETVGAAKECMQWLQSVVRLCAETETTLQWASPAGFPVRQHYRKRDTVEIRTVVGEKVRWTNARRDRDELCLRRQVNGISPNFIHSLDAAALMRTVNLAVSRGVTSFAMVHDSFGTHAADAPTMARTLREVYAQMFSGNLLEEFRAQIQLRIGDRGTVPQPPAQGALEPDSVLDSTYFFA